MKLIKAYIRTYFAYDVVHALEKTCVRRVSAFDVLELGEDTDKDSAQVSSEVGTYTQMTKLEMICKDENVEKVIQIILEHARTGTHGAKGDGIIAISPVEELISVRTGERGANVV